MVDTSLVQKLILPPSNLEGTRPRMLDTQLRLSTYNTGKEHAVIIELIVPKGAALVAKYGAAKCAALAAKIAKAKAATTAAGTAKTMASHTAPAAAGTVKPVATQAASTTSPQRVLAKGIHPRPTNANKVAL
jgi:hypothetical protein